MSQKIRDSQHVSGTLNFALIANDLNQAEIMATEQLRTFTTPIVSIEGKREVKRSFVLNYVRANGQAIVKGLNTYSCSGSLYVDVIQYE